MKINVLIGSILLCLLPIGCSKSGDDGRLTAKTPEQAASALDQSFTTSPPEVKQNVAVVSEALRKREFEKAVVSLQNVQQAPNITVEQGMAIQYSSILLERELINAIERGDPKAQQAYNLLKRMRRN